MKSGSLYFSVDGTIQNSGTAAKTGLTGLMVPTVFYDAGSGTQAAWEMRFDASDWSTTPSGYKAISTANLDDPTIADPTAYFQTTTYSGDGVGSGSGGQEIDQSGNSTFQPDFVWIKDRNLGTETHCLQDAVRGANKRLQSNSNAAENTETEGLLSFDSDGFTVGSRDPFNKSTGTYVGWQWKAAGSGSSNTDGDITSTVSANTTSGFSIVTYSGSGTSGDTVGHGLGVKPSVVIVKPRNATDNWIVNDWSGDYANKLKLNATEAASSASSFVNAASSSTFTLGSDVNVNGSSRTFVAYCWNEVEGFSKFGSYTGNGSTDGPFIYTGFMPEFIMVKSSSNSGTNWDMLDATREPFNTRGNQFFANTSAAEASNDHECDFLSNGFKWRDGSSSNNGSGYTIIYMAFARSPFKTANAQ